MSGLVVPLHGRPVIPAGAALIDRTLQRVGVVRDGRLSDPKDARDLGATPPSREQVGYLIAGSDLAMGRRR